jgi:hypothetical protein
LFGIFPPDSDCGLSKSLDVPTLGLGNKWWIKSLWKT